MNGYGSCGIYSQQNPIQLYERENLPVHWNFDRTGRYHMKQIRRKTIPDYLTHLWYIGKKNRTIEQTKLNDSKFLALNDKNSEQQTVKGRVMERVA